MCYALHTKRMYPADTGQKPTGSAASDLIFTKKSGEA
jgi:hypothetical protein